MGSLYTLNLIKTQNPLCISKTFATSVSLATIGVCVFYAAASVATLFILQRRLTMANYSLAPNEGIIIQYDGVYHNKKRSEIILTNQNLICIETISGIFKTTYNALKFPVNQIKVIKGQAQAAVVKYGNDWVLQILFKNGAEKFEFSCDFLDRLKKKQEADKWVEQISILLTGKSASNITDTALMGGIKNVLGAVGINVKTKQPENVTTKCIGCMAPISGQRGQTVCCKYCDTEQTL